MNFIINCVWQKVNTSFLGNCNFLEIKKSSETIVSPCADLCKDLQTYLTEVLQSLTKSYWTTAL